MSAKWYKERLDDVGKTINRESDTKGLNRTVQIYTLDRKLLKEYKGLIRVRNSDESGRISLNVISKNNRRVTIDNAIVITEEE